MSCDLISQIVTIRRMQTGFSFTFRTYSSHKNPGFNLILVDLESSAILARLQTEWEAIDAPNYSTYICALV
jgi:hypothetical protein